MSKARIYLDGKEIQPRDRNNLAITIDWQNQEVPTASFNTIELLNEDVDIVNTHIATGHIFEGMPLRYEVGDVTLDLVADTANGLTVASCNQMTDRAFD